MLAFRVLVVRSYKQLLLILPDTYVHYSHNNAHRTAKKIARTSIDVSYGGDLTGLRFPRVFFFLFAIVLK